MQTSDLKDRIALSLVRDNSNVIAAGPLVKQPNTIPYRIVMVNWGSQFSVHNQIFQDLDRPISDLDVSCETVFKSHLESGHYFDPKDFSLCCKKFAELLAWQVQYMDSILRDK